MLCPKSHGFDPCRFSCNDVVTTRPVSRSSQSIFTLSLYKLLLYTTFWRRRNTKQALCYNLYSGWRQTVYCVSCYVRTYLVTSVCNSDTAFVSPLLRTYASSLIVPRLYFKNLSLTKVVPAGYTIVRVYATLSRLTLCVSNIMHFTLFLNNSQIRVSHQHEGVE